MSLFPMFLKLEGRPCLIVGGGRIAIEKIESLLPTGAALHVVAPDALPQVKALAAEGRLRWTPRAYQPGDLDGIFVAIAATATPAVNHAVYEEATRRNILSNAVDDPPFCDFYFGSIVRRGDLQIAISTNGDSPALSQRLRIEIDAQLPQDLGPWLGTLGALRREVLTRYPAGETRKRLLHTLAQRSVCEAATCPTRLLAFDPSRNGMGGDASQLAKSAGEGTAGNGVQDIQTVPVLSPSGTASKGTVYLVGAGPGDPDLLTVKAARLLTAADVVLHDDLVPAEIVSLANRDAWVLNVGKRCGAKSITQDEINRLMIDFSQRDLAVVRLKSGDPLVFGRAGEEMDALRSASIPFEVVPGITAAFAAAAALRCSLTDRRAASTVVFSTGHHAHTASAHEEATVHEEPTLQSGATRIVYMPGRDLRSLAADWIEEGLSPELPCVIVSRAALADQHIQSTRLAGLGQIAPGPAPNLVLAGWSLRGVAPSSLAMRSAAANAVAVTR